MHLQNKRKCHKEYFDWHHNGRLMLKASLPNNGMDFQWSQTLHFFNDQFMWEKAPNLKILNTDITAGWEVTENSFDWFGPDSFMRSWYYDNSKPTDVDDFGSPIYSNGFALCSATLDNQVNHQMIN